MMMVPRRKHDYDVFDEMFKEPFFNDVEESKLMRTDIKEKKDKYVIDMDLPGYEKEDIKIKKKRFNGICINDYEIKYLNVDEFDYDKYSLYEQKDIYESQIYQNQPFECIKRKLARDKVQIDYLKGNKTIY